MWSSPNMHGSNTCVASLRCALPLLVLRPQSLTTSRSTTHLAAQSTPSCGVTTLADTHTTVLEVKKSKFVATAGPITSVEDAVQLLQRCADPCASHNCYAYQLASGTIAKASDDGEPSGTAGRPILSAIQAEGLDGVAVVVVRYYGGIKLGAGGLTRSYGQAARDCLRAAPRVTLVPEQVLTMQVPFDHLGVVHSVLNRVQVLHREEQYTQGACVAMRVRVPSDSAAQLTRAVLNATSGAVEAVPANNEPC